MNIPKEPDDMTDSALNEVSRPSLRLAEARYFLKQFITHCGPPTDRYFLMIAYSDAFLALSTSVEDLVPRATKARLRQLPGFRFLKTLRNLTVHHDVILAPGEQGKFGRRFRRIVDESIGVEGAPTSSVLVPVLDRIEDMFQRLKGEKPNQAKNIEGARVFLHAVATEEPHAHIGELFERAIMATVAVVEQGQSPRGRGKAAGVE